jgi:hypothetical protein
VLVLSKRRVAGALGLSATMAARGGGWFREREGPVRKEWCSLARVLAGKGWSLKARRTVATSGTDFG